jgi:hypothetical protein
MESWRPCKGTPNALLFPVKKYPLYRTVLSKIKYEKILDLESFNASAISLTRLPMNDLTYLSFVYWKNDGQYQ